MKSTYFSIAFIALLQLMSQLSSAEEPFNYRNQWVSWNEYERTIYVDGVRDGITNTVIAYMVREYNLVGLDSLNIDGFAQSILNYLDFSSESIRDVLTSLYSDPANCFIPSFEMFRIAIMKLEGKSIDEKLRYERKRVLEMHKLLKSLE